MSLPGPNSPKCPRCGAWLDQYGECPLACGRGIYPDFRNHQPWTWSDLDDKLMRVVVREEEGYRFVYLCDIERRVTYFVRQEELPKPPKRGYL